MQYGIWIAAYSRLEFFTMVKRIGFDKTIYGDTDSNYFVGEEGIKAMEQRNKEIQTEFDYINKKRKVQINPNFGKWLHEKDLDCFKSIGAKWYLTLDRDRQLDVKAAGAEKDNLLNWLKD